MNEFDKYIKPGLTDQDLIDWDIPVRAATVFERFAVSYEKYKGDEEFFLTVYSRAATDWVEKRKQGRKTGSLSAHLSTYLKKESKRRSSVPLNEGLSPLTQKEGDPLSPISLEELPDFNENDNDPPSDNTPFTVHPSPLTPNLTTNDLRLTINDANCLSLLDEITDNEISHDDNDLISLENAGFEKERRKRSALLTGFFIMFCLLIASGIAMTVLSGMFEEAPSPPETPIEDYSDMKKGRIEGSLTKAMNEKESKELTEQKIKSANGDADNASKISSGQGQIRSTGTSGGSYSKNAQKDEEILAKYAESVDPASGGGAESNPRGGRRHFVPGGSAKQGGVFIKGGSEDKGSGKTLGINDIKIKARLEFSIRSTAASTIVAVTTEDHDRIPKGSKFYGSASGYVNKRTQIRFNKLVVNGEEFSIKGFAISGRDPGIESEVTDIAKENIDSSVKQGLVRTASGVAQKYAGVAGDITGDAAANTVDPAGAELNRQQEANKMTTEYRVPAGTAFFIYLE